ncbi:hypothetical protein LEP1GSC103_2077 [Leptospira borgpetersenii serovar Javanica str. UI 09931]|uniref:Uncharacterized protein n=1 Tax=Leptospira borgpetersenii serovar Javanica str. UI 09931 TaxID=1049767 RepID=A0AAV3J8T8_LEPBO|nr:hypothetical protein LEP1GSC101_0134 [Leptospira borgpetersenii str. UI 09149]EKQ99217.1 hypothetical protein LEP1GSC121_2347 [Leptospira borgpetersenii serovar Castellonis str. 200801910]EMN58912.1 hypothetical protein LEP1GSC090_2035 [Leptospira borgpetersenii serovar Javanica str. MK146]EPG56867.1 hypothetical protein LEP1GSC103_2077 [Leptospira borgpetersenii serovar Javanica str. UI 09931]
MSEFFREFRIGFDESTPLTEFNSKLVQEYKKNSIGTKNPNRE